MNRKFWTFFISFVLFLCFVFFSYLVDKDRLDQIDFNTTVRLQDNIPRRFDEPFSWFSVIGNFEVLLIVLLGFFIITRRLWAGFVAFTLFGIFHLIEIYGKNFVDHHPPPEFLLRTEKLVDFQQFHIRAEYSYPSGHSGRTIFLSALFIFFLIFTPRIPKIWKIIGVLVILGFDFVMLLSRVYLGEHWTTDVVGGAFLGASLGLLSAVIGSEKLKIGKLSLR